MFIFKLKMEIPYPPSQKKKRTVGYKRAIIFKSKRTVSRRISLLALINFISLVDFSVQRKYSRVTLLVIALMVNS